jgi:hypothetical protein
MRMDALKQYAKLRQQLLHEKSQLESRLAEINQVLGAETPPPAIQSAAQAGAAPRGRRGGRGGNKLSMREAVLTVLSKGPLGRRDIVNAVQDLGYVFKTRNPLNSIGAILYGKSSPVKSKDGLFYLEGSAQSQASSLPDQNGAAGKSRKKRTMSPEARERIAAAQRARWAKVRRAKA